jgi:hypothetical protein
MAYADMDWQALEGIITEDVAEILPDAETSIEVPETASVDDSHTAVEEVVIPEQVEDAETETTDETEA